MVTEKSCPQCGAVVGERANKIYCSAACKLQAFRQKMADKSAVGAAEEDDALPAPPSGSRSSNPSARSASAPKATDPKALRIQAQMRKAELAHELELEKMRLAAQERAREREQAPAPSPAAAAPVSYEERARAAKEAQAARERHERDKSLADRYEELVTEFLGLEGQELLANAYADLHDEIKDHEGDYRKHSGLRASSPASKQRLDFLDEMQEVLRETLREINRQPTPFFGRKTGSFDLKKKWRAALRNSLLG